VIQEKAPGRVDTPVGRAWRVIAPIATSPVALGALLAAVSWPGTAARLAPTAGLDPSWQAALAMAVHRHLDFGTQIIWTYGPFGFLTTRSLYYPVPAALALAFHFATATAAFAVLIAALRRYTSLTIAVVVAYVAGFPIVAVWGGEEVVLALAFVFAVRILSRPDAANGWIGLWLGFGALAGFMLLEKPSLGVGIAALAAIALGCAAVPHRLRAIALAVGSLVTVFVAGWFATGNGVGNLVAYARGAREATAGYTAMATNPTAGHYVGLAVVAGLAVIAASALSARSLRPASAVGLVAATALVTWMLFKEGFVRQDAHRIVFFAALPIVVAALLLGPVVAPRASGARVVALVVIPAVAALAVYGAVPSGLIDPVANGRGFVATVRALAIPERRHNLTHAARASLQARYAIPPAMLARIGRHRVDVAPWEETVVWAYPELRWRPLPTLQSYFAYTARLDDLDVDAVSSNGAPRFLLRQVPKAIDGRVAAFEAPATQVAIACHYRQVASVPAWQLLELTDDRCGAARELGQQRVAFGETVEVPNAAPDEMVVGRFDLHLPWWWPVAETLYKPPLVTIRLNGADHPNRFVVGTGNQLHVLALPATTHSSPPFAALTIRRLELGVGGGAERDYSATITFAAIPLR
jgi:hypothetical protein